MNRAARRPPAFRHPADWPKTNTPMKYFIHPRKIAAISTLAFVALTLLFFSINLLSTNLFISLLITIPAFSAISFFLINQFINHFIYEKIKPIYKTINSFRPGSPAEANEKDLFSKVNNEVTQWMEGKADELQKLKELEIYRKEYLGNVSHELKTPIFNIQGYILTLLDGGIDDPHINLLYLNRTEKSIDRMIHIIEDLEDISKLEAGELQLNFIEFNLIPFIDEVCELQEIRAQNKHIKLRPPKLSEKPVLVSADKDRMFQVLSNLVVNSINYGIEGGQTSIKYYDMDNRILIEVKDNGIGISDKDLPRVFERFYRADKSRSRDQGGTGLGLAIVKHIIEAHQQTINVSSTVGKGTSFTFTLQKAAPH